MVAKITHWLMAGVCLLLVALALSLSWLRWGIDHNPLYHQWVEKEVSRAIGQELKLESFQIRLVGKRLQLSLTGLETVEGLTLARLALGVDLWGSLQEDVLRLSHVQAKGLVINVRQQKDGTWTPQANSQNGSQTVPQLMLAVATRVPQLLLNDISLTLKPNQGQPISMPKLDAQVHVAENADLGLTRIILSLHDDTDTKVLNYDLETQVTLDIKNNKTIQRAQIYLHSNDFEIAPWLSLLVTDESSAHLNSLRLGGKYWLDYQANKHLQLVTKNARLLLLTPTDQVDLIGDIRATSLLGEQVTLDWKLLDWHLTGQALSGQVNGVALPFNELQAYKINQRLILGSPKLHLADTQKLLNTIKILPAKINLPIQSLAPKGWVHQSQLHLDFQKQLEFLFTGNMRQVSINAWSGAPQINQADGHIWLNRYGGKVVINDTDGLQLRITKLTSLPWQFSGLKGEFNWRYGALSNRFSSSNINANFDQGYINAKMAGAFPRKGSTEEPFIQLALGMQNLNLGTLPGKLPDILIGRKLGAWLATAAPMGTLTEAALIYNGRPGNIANAAGVMARSMPIVANVEAPNFSYHQHWPKVKGLKADLTVDHNGASVEVQAGSVEHSQITQSVKGWRVEVPVFQTVDKQLRYITVQGQIAGEASKLMTLAEELPVHVNLPSWLNALKPQGKVSLNGNLVIPFGHKSNVTYDLKVSSNNLNGYWEPLQAHLRHVELEVGLNSAHGGIETITGNGLIDGQFITFKRLSKVDLEKRWLSRIPNKILRDVNANLTAEKDNLTMEFEGRLPPHYLATKVNQPWVQEISGELPFVARLSTCAQTAALCTLLSAEVDLTKAGIDLPAPLSQLQQLQLLGYWTQDYQNWYASIDHHQVAVKLGPDKNSSSLIALGTNVAFQGAVDWAQQGQWTLGGQIDFLDLAPWLDVYQNRIQTWWTAADTESAAAVLPEIDVKIIRTAWNGLDFDQASIIIEPLSEAGDFSTLQPWRLSLTSEQLAGKIDYFGDEHPLTIHIDYVNINFPEPIIAMDEDKDLLENFDPSKFLDADVTINKIVKNGESFGQWQFKTRRQGAQVSIHDLEAYIRHSFLQGNLIWDKTDGVHRTQFTGRVESSDVANMLVDWGYSPSLDVETAAIEVQLDWPRSPLAFAVKEASGDLGLRLKKGSFSSSPNVAKGLRILALLDMNRLMQRLQLDFSDIIQPGFGFDSIAVQYHFENGLASTVSPLMLKSATLQLAMDGWIDFNQRQVDNNLIVTLPVVDKLPLAALFAGLPQLSGMIYLASKLIGDELATFTSARYSVLGSLDSPDVTLVKMFDKDYQQQSIQERIENVISVE